MIPARHYSKTGGRDGRFPLGTASPILRKAFALLELLFLMPYLLAVAASNLTYHFRRRTEQTNGFRPYLRRLLRQFGNTPGARRDVDCLILAVAVVRELGWSFFSNSHPDLAGSWQAILTWPLISLLMVALTLHRPVSRLRINVCISVCVFTATTSVCEIAWMIAPWPIPAVPSDSCSVQYGVPLTLIMCGFALFPLLTRSRRRGTPRNTNKRGR